MKAVALASNIAPDPWRGFRLRGAEAIGHAKSWLICEERMSGTFHTHTLQDATPSTRDLAMMRLWAGVHIIAAADGSFRAFISHKRIVEMRIVTRQIHRHGR